jgi:hypothetical protein
MPDPRLPRGALLRLGVVALIAAFALTPPLARADVFDPWLGEGAPTCAPLAGLKEVARVVELTPEQFQFVRALYVAIPPISRELPPGDRAIMATASDGVMLALIDGDKTCARMAAPPFVVDMVMAVGRGDVGHARQGL